MSNTIESNFDLRALCVDTHEDSREMLTTLLRFSRIEAKAVATSAQALTLARSERWGLYLLEAWLPDIDGFELCRRLRHLDSATPIVFFSGAGYHADQLRGLEAGATAYVIKPDVDGLLGRIKQFVSGPQCVDTKRLSALRDNSYRLPEKPELSNVGYSTYKQTSLVYPA